MKNLLAAILLSITVFALSVTASSAAESSVYAAVTSNYVFRGQTQTKDAVAIQGGYDIKQSKDDAGWYAGSFASTVDIGGDKGLEVDLYAGWKGIFGTQNNLGYDVGAIIYNYSNSNTKSVTELYAGVNYETAYVKLFSGSGSGVSDYTYFDIGASFVVLKDIDLDVHYGRMSSSNANDLSAALSMDVKGFDLSLGLTYEDEGSKNDIEFFVTVSKEFDI